MISRVYTVLMPADAGVTAAIDIAVEECSGPQAQGTGFYAEWRNRPLRVPVKAGSAATPANGFVPLFRLGFSMSLLQTAGADATNVPVVRCSRSLVGDVLTLANGTTTPGDGTFQDPAGKPTIRVVNTAAVQGRLFRLYLEIMEEDNDPLGA
jgi:hypothetical protein